MNEVLVIDNLEFEVRRSHRRKTLGLTVDRSGELVVHSPEAVNGLKKSASGFIRNCLAKRSTVTVFIVWKW